MAHISFTSNLKRHVDCPEAVIAATCLRDLLRSYFDMHPRVKKYVVDDQGCLRQHVVIFLDGEHVVDRVGFLDPLRAESEVFVFQALSGG